MTENSPFPIQLLTQSVSNSSGNTLTIDVDESADQSYTLVFPASNSPGLLKNDGDGSLSWLTITNVTSPKNVYSISELLLIDFTVYPIVNLVGFYSAGDIPEGTLYYDSASTLTHDGCMVIHRSAPVPTTRSALSSYLQYVSSGSGRWVRKNKNYEIPIEWFGETNPTSATDASVPITKALTSSNTKNMTILLNSAIYTLATSITLPTGTSFRNLRGKGDDTKIVSSKATNVYPLIYVSHGCFNIYFEKFKLQAWDYPAEGESGWLSNYKYGSEGRYKFADQVTTTAASNGFDEDVIIDTTNALNQTLFPLHTYDHSTLELMIIGNASPVAKAFTIGVVNGQISDIVTTITVSNVPSNFNTNTHSTLVRFVTNSSALKQGFTNIPSVSNAVLPDGFSSSAGAKAKITCDVQYNYDSTFTLTFKFNEALNLSALTTSSYYDGTTYTIPLVLDIYGRAYNIDLDSLTFDGLYYTGIVQIGYNNSLTLHAVYNVKVRNCIIRNVSNDGISMKEQFDSWGPTVQTSMQNIYVYVQNCRFNNLSTSGIDFEGDYILIENNVFSNIRGLGAIRLGARSFGTVTKINIVRNNVTSLTSTSGSAGNIIVRTLGQSLVRRVIISECELKTAFSGYENIRILFSGGNVDNAIIDKCTFLNYTSAVHVGASVKNISLQNSVCRDIYTTSNNKFILYQTGSGNIARGSLINNHIIRVDGGNSIFLFNTSQPVDYSSVMDCANLSLSATNTYPIVFINFRYYVRSVINSLHSMATNINLNAISYAFGSLPSVNAHNIILITGTSVSPTTTLAYSDGTNWRRIDTHAIVS